MKSFYSKVAGVLENVINDNYKLDIDYPLWEVPSKQSFGDLSSMVALKIASKLKRDPLEIANEIKRILEKKIEGDFDKIEILRPGFINIFIAQKILVDSLNDIIRDKDKFFSGNIGQKILIEFLSANPTGPLSIAHGRQAVVGDVIANILEFCGSDVTREYYVNDAGRQLELFGVSVEAAVESLNNNTEFLPPEGGYKGGYIKDIAQEYIDKKKNIDIKTFSVNKMLLSIKDDLALLDIKFDNWVSQEEIIARKEVEGAIKFLEDKKLIYKKEGALWFAASNFGDDKDRVIKKVDGELTYFASDIAYHQKKCKGEYDKLINLWGPDHHGYIKRVESAIAALGYNQTILKIIIIQLVTLKTKERMSKRAGNIFRLSDLVNDVGKDTARFYYLTRKNSSHLEFDIDLAKKASFDNPLYYIQYVCARIESIFKKTEITAFNQEYSKFLIEEEETDLLRIMLQFSHYIEKAYHSLEPVFIVEFLKSLAAGFHKFYEKKRVLVEEDKNVTQARINLLAGVRIICHCALRLLGITPVEEM